MVAFSEKVTVQKFITDRLVDNGWTLIDGADLDRDTSSPIIPSHVEQALLRLNPVLRDNRQWHDDVFTTVSQSMFAASTDGLMSANKSFRERFVNGYIHRFPGDDEYSEIKLVDFDDYDNNEFVVSREVTYQGSGAKKYRFDVVLWINGFPVSVIECKAITEKWVSGADDIEKVYVPNAPAFFTSNVLNVAFNGAHLYYGAIGAPNHLWQQWGSTETDFDLAGLERVKLSIDLLLSKSTLLNIASDFTLYQTKGNGGLIKVIPRYVQVEAAQAIHERVRTPNGGNGLIHHYQGTGKTLLMVFTACKIMEDDLLNAQTILVIVDRIDLLKNVADDFYAAGIENVKIAGTSTQLRTAVKGGAPGVVISTIFRFRQADVASGEVWNSSENFVVMVDEAHRTQDGDLGTKMRQVLPNARFFGMTGTPINDKQRDTFGLFGNDADKGKVLSKYTMERAIADGTSVPVVVEPRLVNWNLKEKELDEAFEEMAKEEKLSEEEKTFLTRKASKVKAVMTNPHRIQAVCEDIVDHYLNNVAPLGFKAQVVAYDKEMCVLYEKKINEILRQKGSSHQTKVVMSYEAKADAKRGWDKYQLSREQEGKVIDNFNTHNKPPHILIVTAKLLTGFNAPIEQVMYFDKPLKREPLFQAITRTNRTYSNPLTGKKKQYGIIVDYIGVAKNIAEALKDASPERGDREIDLDGVIDKLEEALQVALERFEGIDRTSNDFETFQRAVARFSGEGEQEEFAREFMTVEGLWETVYPHAKIADLEPDYAWLATLYQTVLINGKAQTDYSLIWEKLGAKTIKLIHEHISDVSLKRTDRIKVSPQTINGLRDLAVLVDGDIDVIVDEDISVEDILDTLDKRIKRRLSDSKGATVVVTLAEQLEDLRRRSTATMEETESFIKKAVDLARKIKALDAEEDDHITLLPPADHIGALTRIVTEYKPAGATILVENLAKEIDQLASDVTFAGWNSKSQGDQEVKRKLRQSLMKYKLPPVGDLFEALYAYVAEHY